MIGNKDRRIKIIMFIGITIAVCLCIYLLLKVIIYLKNTSNPEELETKIEGIVYFDPSLLLSSTDDMSFFFDEPVLKYEESALTTFTFDEYLLVYQMAYQYIWREEIQNFDVDLIRFDTHCNNINNSFFQSNIYLYKMLNESDKKRIDRSIIINVELREIVWTEKVFRVYENRTEKLDIYNFNLNPSEVLEKAKIYGYNCERFNLDESNSIMLTIAPGRYQNGWNVAFGNKAIIIINKKDGSLERETIRD